MDPIVTLNELRTLVARMPALAAEANRLFCEDAGSIASEEALDELCEAASRTAELFDALDQWRRRGGFDPWQVERVRFARAQRRQAQSEQAMRAMQGLRDRP